MTGAGDMDCVMLAEVKCGSYVLSRRHSPSAAMPNFRARGTSQLDRTRRVKRSTHQTCTIEMRTCLLKGDGHELLCHCRCQNEFFTFQ